MPRVLNLNKYIIKQSNKVSARQTVEGFRERLIRDKTEAEKIFIHILNVNNIKYDFQKVFNVKKGKKPKFKIVDFYLPDYYIVVEIDGEYHQQASQLIKDKARERLLLKKPGIKKILRFTNGEVMDYSPNKIIKIIQAYV